ncbi:MAG: hypothetical protein AB7F28_04505 [Candidatus Margulisiibacteriota bacterium]
MFIRKLIASPTVQTVLEFRDDLESDYELAIAQSRTVLELFNGAYASLIAVGSLVQSKVEFVDVDLNEHAQGLLQPKYDELLVFVVSLMQSLEAMQEVFGTTDAAEVATNVAKITTALSDMDRVLGRLTTPRITTRDDSAAGSADAESVDDDSDAGSAERVDGDDDVSRSSGDAGTSPDFQDIAKRAQQFLQTVVDNIAGLVNKLLPPGAERAELLERLQTILTSLSKWSGGLETVLGRNDFFTNPDAVASDLTALDAALTRTSKIAAVLGVKQPDRVFTRAEQVRADAEGVESEVTVLLGGLETIKKIAAGLGLETSGETPAAQVANLATQIDGQVTGVNKDFADLYAVTAEKAAVALRAVLEEVVGSTELSGKIDQAVAAGVRAQNARLEMISAEREIEQLQAQLRGLHADESSAAISANLEAAQTRLSDAGIVERSAVQASLDAGVQTAAGVTHAAAAKKIVDALVHAQVAKERANSEPTIARQAAEVSAEASQAALEAVRGHLSKDTFEQRDSIRGLKDLVRYAIILTRGGDAKGLTPLLREVVTLLNQKDVDLQVLQGELVRAETALESVETELRSALHKDETDNTDAPALATQVNAKLKELEDRLTDITIKLKVLADKTQGEIDPLLEELGVQKAAVISLFGVTPAQLVEGQSNYEAILANLQTLYRSTFGSVAEVPKTRIAILMALLTELNHHVKEVREFFEIPDSDSLCGGFSREVAKLTQHSQRVQRVMLRTSAVVGASAAVSAAVAKARSAAASPARPSLS